MRLSDIPAVMAIEILAFPTPWKASAYEYEITSNRLANYQVLTAQLGDRPEKLIGYAGFWMMGGEAHISTIAVNPNWQGRGLGELLLLNLLDLTLDQKASLVTLEVRRGNVIAQALYSKYRFLIVGERPRYYQGKEDALLMTVQPLDEKYRHFLRQARQELFKHLEAQGRPGVNEPIRSATKRP